MNNLTTRKIVLGMLLVLVLAFSVQGIADAADLPLSKTSGDLQTKLQRARRLTIIIFCRNSIKYHCYQE